jgi:hypothetical protein
MAHMIPEQPKEFNEYSHEDVVFDCLSQLSDDYYVFHSYHPVVVSKENTLYDREMDFLIANREKGFLAIEAKAGKHIRYENRTWYYGSGKEMEKNGPYNQIATAMRSLKTEIKDNSNPRIRALFPKCRTFTAVCFMDLSEKNFRQIPALPEEADRKITILHDDLDHIQEKIESIFDMKLSYEAAREKNGLDPITPLSDTEFAYILNHVICPTFDLVPSPEATNDLIKHRLKKLLKEQYMILDFLEEQPSAVINGLAGTGKTMIALEKARRHSMRGEKVLFLCYNKKLQYQLVQEYQQNKDKGFREQYKNIDFMTLSKLAKEKAGGMDDFEGLDRWLAGCIRKENEFGYQHVIVDEGQDFGVVDTSEHPEKIDEAMQNCDILNKLQDVALSSGGTFYLFYDKYQMIQGGKSLAGNAIMPDCIEDADCRLTLHKNCRNTEQIAKTSVTPLRDKKDRHIKINAARSWIDSVVPKMHVVRDSNDELKVLNRILDELHGSGLDDVVILTQGTIQYSALEQNDRLVDRDQLKPYDPYDYYRHGGKLYRVATCITFKGLEADAIVLMDLDKDSFVGEQGMEFYVGSSRAKCRLDMICKLNDSDYFDIVHELDPNAPSRNKNPEATRRLFGNLFSADVIVEE